ncbi:MAG: GbsR/MarR family transcriptional regulator [Planctomycetota bacterium]|jgi:predicted transcriptional regulator
MLDAQEGFVQLWGQMGSSWGIPRTMAEVHALLFVTGRPMNTDEVMERLKISRGNASMTLRALVEWRIVYREHVRGDRKEYFVAEQDVWKLFRRILRERKKREIDPLLDALHACRGLTAPRVDGSPTPDPATLKAHNARLDELIEFVRLIDVISQRFISPSGQGLEKAARLLARAS